MKNKPVHNFLGLKLRMDFKEAHHLYWGVVMALVFGWLKMPVLCVIGVLIALDDVYQHAKQVKNPDYHSPIHRAYGWFYQRSGLLRKLNWFADVIMRGK